MTARLVLAVGVLLALTACGSADGPEARPGSPSSTTTTSAPSQSPSSPSGTESARGYLVTVRGTVSKGVEAGCLVLAPEGDTSGGPLLLIGNTESLRDGDTVTLRGARMDDMVTTCQQGLPFRVEEVLER